MFLKQIIIKFRRKISPRADWKIVLGKYRFLVEQKSTILGLLAKQQESSINTIRQFAERNIIKALEQLKSTEDGLNDGQYIKIVLLYEDYLKAEALSEIFQNGRMPGPR